MTARYEKYVKVSQKGNEATWEVTDSDGNIVRDGYSQNVKFVELQALESLSEVSPDITFGKKVGVSFAFSVIDIAEGRMPLDKVDKVIANTRCNSEEDWRKVIDNYATAYWEDYPEEAKSIAWELVRSQRVDQPRIDGRKIIAPSPERWTASIALTEPKFPALLARVKAVLQKANVDRLDGKAYIAEDRPGKGIKVSSKEAPERFIEADEVGQVKTNYLRDYDDLSIESRLEELEMIVSADREIAKPNQVEI